MSNLRVVDIDLTIFQLHSGSQHLATAYLSYPESNPKYAHLDIVPQGPLTAEGINALAARALVRAIRVDRELVQVTFPESCLGSQPFDPTLTLTIHDSVYPLTRREILFENFDSHEGNYTITFRVAPLFNFERYRTALSSK